MMIYLIEYYCQEIKIEFFYKQFSVKILDIFVWKINSSAFAGCLLFSMFTDLYGSHKSHILTEGKIIQILFIDECFQLRLLH